MIVPCARPACAGLLLFGAACAQMEMPPGGPEDRMPPTLVATRPDSFAVVPNWDDPVVIAFSERISEQGVEGAVMVSPRTSPVAVDRGSREVRVSLRRGWQPGQIYHVTLQPLIQDLFNNRITEPVQIVFSTGPPIPATRLTGVIIDRISGDPEADVRIEAIRRADSLVYAVPTDSIGRFVLAHIPEGEYLVRAFPDQNRNRNLDSFEARDTVVVSVTTTDSASVDLSIVLPDSTSPQLVSARVDGEQRVELRFDDYLDPAQEVEATSVTIVGPDSVPVAIAAVTIGAPRDAAGRPSLPEPAAPAAADTAAVDAAADTAAVDTVAVPVALPSQLLIVELAEGVELIPEAEYRVTARGLRNIVGLVGDAETEFTTPELPPEPAAPDTTGAPADNVAQRPGKFETDPSLAVGYQSGAMRQPSQMRTGRLFHREGAKTPGDKARRFLREKLASWGHEHVGS